ncbi:phosphatase domain-containing protein [Frankia sp. AgKG'84/4]|uniref:phosphatase domain-containing protein n=1 Tax=Frankia sp. AgKG'84/4 TaxID=573490 RepID=UPI0035B42C71
MTDAADATGSAATGTGPPGRGGAIPAQRPLAVIDVDGVVADVRHRLQYLRSWPGDWDAFFAAAPADPPLAEGVELVRRLARDHEVVWLTGRPERSREATARWLREQELPRGELRMRPDDDRRPARVFKRAQLRELGAGRQVAVVVDDDPAVVDLLRADGWPVLRAQWLEYEPTLGNAQESEGRT